MGLIHTHTHTLLADNYPVIIAGNDKRHGHSLTGPCCFNHANKNNPFPRVVAANCYRMSSVPDAADWGLITAGHANTKQFYGTPWLIEEDWEKPCGPFQIDTTVSSFDHRLMVSIKSLWKCFHNIHVGLSSQPQLNHWWTSSTVSYNPALWLCHWSIGGSSLEQCWYQSCCSEQLHSVADGAHSQTVMLLTAWLEIKIH